MKKQIILLLLLLIQVVSYSQNSVLVYASRICVSDEVKVPLSNVYMDINTAFKTGGTVSFTTFMDDGYQDHTYNITKVEQGGDVTKYRCIGDDGKETALLIVYRKVTHHNVYSQDGNFCEEREDDYCILRRRTPYGYMEYRFML